MKQIKDVKSLEDKVINIVTMFRSEDNKLLFEAITTDCLPEIYKVTFFNDTKDNNIDLSLPDPGKEEDEDLDCFYFSVDDKFHEFPGSKIMNSVQRSIYISNLSNIDDIQKFYDKLYIGIIDYNIGNKNIMNLYKNKRKLYKNSLGS